MIGFDTSRAEKRPATRNQYSFARGRSLIRMSARRFLLRPVVVLAARVMGPGPARLRMVKLAHSLGRTPLTVVPVEERIEPASVQPSTRAA